MSALGSFLSGGQRLIAICPCCDEVFQILHARFVFPSRDPGECEYAELLALERQTGNLSERLERIEQKQDAILEKLRLEATALGQRRAKRRLREIDHVFSARKINPQDVKVLFDPVDYIVFAGLNDGGVRELRFINHEPDSRLEESLVRQIAKVVKSGNISFNTLRVDNKDGSISLANIQERR